MRRLLLLVLVSVATLGLAAASRPGDAASPVPRGARYSADRSVLAWQDIRGALWVVVRGGPRQILLREGPDVYNEGVGFWDWAPSGHLLVSNVRRRIFVVDAKTGRRTDISPVGTPAAAYIEPLWSPAGDLIEYARQTPKGSGCASVDIGVAAAAGGPYRLLHKLFEPTTDDKKQAASGGLGCGGGKLEEALVNTALTQWSHDGRALLVPRKGSASGKPLQRVKVDSAGPTLGRKVIASLERRLGTTP